MLNVGTAGPADQQGRSTPAKLVPLPPKLFSHNDQQSIWQSSSPEGATSGWGGRIGDLFESGNGNATFTCITVAGNAVFLSGDRRCSTRSPPAARSALNSIKAPLFGSTACSAALRAAGAPASRSPRCSRTRYTR